MKATPEGSNKAPKKPTLFIDKNDPRLLPANIGKTLSRSNAEIMIVDKSGLVGLAGANIAAFSGLPDPDTKDTTPTPTPIPGPGTSSTPTGVSGCASTWVGSTLHITWNFDSTNVANAYVFEFVITFTVGSVTKTVYAPINKASTSQFYDLNYDTNAYLFGFFQQKFDSIVIKASDSLNNFGGSCSHVSPLYKNSLPIPVITVTTINQGYSVAWTPITDTTFNFISIEEYISTDNVNIPTGDYTQVYLDSVNPAIVIASTTEGRWVKARFTDKAGTYGEYCTAVYVTPTATVAVNTTPPNAVTAVSAVWSGNDIVISYTLPTTLAGSYFQVALTPTTGVNGYFYIYPDGTSNLNQTATIRKADIFSQFGRYYSSFPSALLTSFSALGIKDPHGVSFSVAQRANPFLINGSLLVPTFTLTGIVNGYSATFSLPSYATFGEVYQKYTSWSGITSPVDSFTGSYSSGGTSGTATITLTNVKDNHNATLSPIPTGYIITGTGIPANTYILSVNGNTITLSNNLTAQASGTYSAQGLVYAGTGPANIPSTLYQNTYILVRYYDDFDNGSAVSAEQIVIPYQPVTADVIGPPNVSSTGLSTTSGIDSSGTLGFNGYINLSWPAVTDSQLRGYRIRFTTDALSPVYSYVDYPIDQSNPPTGTLSYKLTGLAVGATYKLAVATYDQYNNLSTAFTAFTDVAISGTPAITNYISAGNFKFGYGVNTSTDKGLYFDSSNYWYITSTNSARLKVGGDTSNYLLWDGSSFTIDGNISARGGSFQGNVALTASGASIYSGDVTTNPGNLTGDGFILNSGGLLIRKGTNQVSMDTTTGGISANYGSIAGWDITSAKIEKLSSTKYAGLSPSGTYAFWAGSSVSGGDTNQFAVDRTGKVYASAVQITGGALDIGATSSNLTSGFHVTSLGKMYADGAQITGTLSVTGDSTFKSNIQLWTDNTTYGSIYGGASPTSGARTVMNYKGFAAYSSASTGNNNSVTEILTTPIGDTQTTPGGNTISMPTLYNGINFFTKGAIIGGWIVNDGVITSDKSKQITLTSGTNAGIVMSGIVGTNTNYTVGMSVPSAAGDKVFWAGSSKSAANFYVDTTGSLTATGATITGILKSADRTSSTDTSNNGYYFTSSDGSFIAGSASSYIQYNGSLNPITLQASASRSIVDNTNLPTGDTATGYSSFSRISLDPTYGTLIKGVPIQGNIDMTDAGSGGHYLGISSMGRLPRQRMVVENPSTGVLQLGMAVYYQNLSTSTSVPGASSGYVGDLWVSF
jgi:hypothetical protein